VDQPKRFSVGAVLIGSAVDIGGTFLASIFIGIIAAATLMTQGMTPVQLQTRLQGNTAFVIGELILGLGFSGLGGYVAARVAKFSELMHAGSTALICLAFGLLTLPLASQSAMPNWFRIVGEVLVIPMALAGGLIAKRRNHPAA